ncbi:MAG: hypothetical protein AAFP04_03150, partial [Myxococcota bacterium]
PFDQNRLAIQLLRHPRITLTGGVEGQSSTEHREHGLKLRDFRSGPTAVKIRVERSPPDREADRESDNKVDIEFLLSVT